jgi:hypothetical protein
MRARIGVVGVLGLLAGCGFDIPPPSYVTITQIAAVREVVVELGPLHPARVGPLFTYDDEMPIAEVLPGDRVLLDTVVIDVDGVPLTAEAVETLWLQCGADSCAEQAGGLLAPDLDVPCSALVAYTTDSFCRLGIGTTEFEFMAPELGPEILGIPYMSFYGIVAWAGRRADDCWIQRIGSKEQLDGCGFIEHSVRVGPKWWMDAYAESIGLPPPSYDPDLLPAALIGEPANRIPRAPELMITIDGELVAKGRPSLETHTVQPGAEIDIALTFDVTSQLLQGSFRPVDAELMTFTFEPERVRSRTLTTGAIRRLGEELPVTDDGKFRYGVDTFASPGISRVLIGWRDARGANDILTLEFEVE